MLKKIREGCCMDHMGAIALARKDLLTGYYRPSMIEDALSTTQKCEGCQRHGQFLNNPTSVMRSVLATCPFDQWGIDILRPFPLPRLRRNFF